MSEDIVISVDELQVLFNYLGGTMKVKYPLYDFGLFRAQEDVEGYNIEFLCHEKDFDPNLDRFGRLAREVPSHNDFRECLMSSGVMRYTNLDAFRKRLNAYAGMPDEIKFSLDTNLLYHRFISNHRLIKPSEVVLVDIVEEEILGKMNFKYKQSHINELKREAVYQKEYIDELWNRRKQVSRRAAYIASRELQYIKEGIADVLESENKDYRKEGENDRTIVRTLVKLKREGDVTPVLLTADDALVDLCQAKNLSYFKFDMPHRVKNTHCDFCCMRELIFNLAAVFGFIKVNSVVIFGEYKGKSANNPDLLKLRFLDTKFYDEFQRDLNVCRKLVKLRI